MSTSPPEFALSSRFLTTTETRMPADKGISTLPNPRVPAGSRYGKAPELVWAAVDSNHLPPRWGALNGIGPRVEAAARTECNRAGRRGGIASSRKLSHAQS